jgi:ribose-phosphate pyrophosphokinase
MLYVALPEMSSLAQSIAHALKAKLIVPELIQFADGEIEIRLPDPSSIQGKHICIIQSIHPPVHDTLMQLMILSNELNNAGAKTVTALIPYLGYARHEAPIISGGQTSIALMIKLLHAAGIQNIITLQMHNPAIISTFALPVHSISLAPFIAAHIKQTFPNLKKICLIAPDKGAQSRVQEIAQILGVPYNSFAKERYAADKTKIISMRGDCKGTIAIIIDDIVDTGETALNVCHALRQQGYQDIYGYFVHPVLSGDAAQKIQASPFTRLFVSDSIPLVKSVPKIEIFAITKAIAQVLRI